MQMICALLVFQTPALPAPLSELSPWLDWLSLDRADLLAALAAQEHRRFIKTHTPLDGLPLDPRVTYVVVARHPLDMAVSLYHHYANLDVGRIAELAGQPDPGASTSPIPLREWLLSWIAGDGSPQERPDSLTGVLWHARDAWSRAVEPNASWSTTMTWPLIWRHRCGNWLERWVSRFRRCVAGAGGGGGICQHASAGRPARTGSGRNFAGQHRFLPAGTTRRRPGCADG